MTLGSNGKEVGHLNLEKAANQRRIEVDKWLARY